MMKNKYMALIAGLLSASPAFGATSFTGAPNADFALAGNWDNGLPGSANPGGDGTIDSGRISDLGSNFQGGTSTLTVGGNGSAGTLNINNGGTYSTANGGASDVRVGVGAGSIGTININSGGNLSVLGAGADLFLGDAAGGQGFINVNAGGNLDARKALEIINGKLLFASTASYSAGQPQDELVIDNAGILGFQTDGSIGASIAGGTLALELGSKSTLHMELGGFYTVGDTWKILTGVSSFGGVNGGDGTGVFGKVADPNNENYQFIVHYGDGLASAGEVVVELSAIPEPSSTALLGLGGLALILRRRK